MQKTHSTDVDIAYTDRGRGRPVLLVHGFPLDRSMWNEQIAVLEHECRVIAPDLRGFGQTPLAVTDREADERANHGVAMEEYADDLAALLNAIGIDEPVILAGFSMGGYIAWQFWRKYTHRMRALVACDTRAVGDSAEAKSGRLEMANHVAQWGSGRVAEMMLPKLFAPESFTERKELVEATGQVIAATDPRAIAAAQRGMAQRPDVTGWLPQIDVPVQVIVGEKDAISRVEEMQSIADALPNAEIAIVPSAGHMAPVENPKVFNAALLRFVDSLAEK
jgi:pimeloyl-ACP methyl ester carboxylesterase